MARNTTLPPLKDSHLKEDLLADVATGAESGIDYSTHWLQTPLDGVFDPSIPRRRDPSKKLIVLEQ
jgi:hypothetical protein